VGHHKREAAGYGYAPKCSYINVPSCTKVPYQVPHTIHVPKCTDVPKEHCIDTYKKVPETVCVDVPREVCKDVPKQVKFSFTFLTSSFKI
jgi:hypothetical protein